MRRVERLSSGLCAAIAVAGLGALLWVAGCATAGYQPLAHTTASPTSDRWQALQELARAEGWQILNADQSAGSLEAVQTDSADLRDHITVKVLPDRTVVAIHTEIRSGQEWLTTDARCSEYKYSRERSMAARLDRTPVEPRAALALKQ